MQFNQLKGSLYHNYYNDESEEKMVRKILQSDAEQSIILN